MNEHFNCLESKDFDSDAVVSRNGKRLGSNCLLTTVFYILHMPVDSNGGHLQLKLFGNARHTRRMAIG